MGAFLLKTVISALLIAGASELARRSTVAGALLVSLPLTSLLAIAWLWRDTHDAVRIAAFASDILWLVLPSLLLFVVLPIMLRSGYSFWLSLGCGLAATMVGYGAIMWLRSASA
ncbi:MAG: DUF3147 family protein [Dokdonella sp.]